MLAEGLSGFGHFKHLVGKLPRRRQRFTCTRLPPIARWDDGVAWRSANPGLGSGGFLIRLIYPQARRSYYL